MPAACLAWLREEEASDLRLYLVLFSVVDLASGMSLLQIDDALCHWLAGHNVILDFLDNGEPWPKPVAVVAELLSASAASSVRCLSSAGGARVRSLEEEERRLEFVNAVCASAREWEKTRSGEQFPWAHILAGLLEEVVPDSTTYFDCEFVMPRPEASTARKRGGPADCSPLRGTASLLVLLELDPTSPHIDDSADSVGGRTVTEAQTQTREVVAIDRQASCRPKDATSAPSKITSKFDEDGGLIVDLNLSSSLSDVTLYDVVEGDDSDFSVGVEIEEASETQKPSSVGHKEALHVPRQARCVSNIPSIATEYSSVSRCRTTTSSSCLTATSSSTDSKRRALPWKLYKEMSPTALELHLFPSPFHPQPLAPLLCVGDEQNIVPLMCSALHQRRAVGRASVPVVGILMPGSSSTCEVLFGWVEKGPRPGRTLARIHICARGLSSRIPTVFDLERPYSMLCLVRFFAGLGAQADRLRADSSHDPEGRARGSRELGWRADTHFRAGFRASCDESEARIRLWTYEVWCCNQVQEEDDLKAGVDHEIIPRASQLTRRNQRRSDNEQLVKLLRQSVADLFMDELPKELRRSRSRVSVHETRKALCERSTSTQSALSTKGNVRSKRSQADDATKGDSRVVSWCSSCSDGSNYSDADTLWQRAYNVLAFWS